jgi:hypothetical protein
VLPDAAPLPEFELDPELELALPPLGVVPGLALLVPVAEELALTRAGVVKAPVEFLYAPAPPHPAITAIKKKESKTALCRIRASRLD